MHSTSRISCLMIAACMSAAAFFTRSTDAVVRTCQVAYAYVRDLVLAAPAKFKEDRVLSPTPSTSLVQACAYVLRLAKRERPHVRSQWRMCPSV